MADLTRPIIGIEDCTAQEVFDIMCDRFALADPSRGGLVEALREIAAERERQKSVEGWTAAHDDRHPAGEIALAGAAYAYASQYPDDIRAAHGRPGWWPWGTEWWKPTTPRRDLVKAAALIVAEIERLDRAALLSAIEASK